MAPPKRVTEKGLKNRFRSLLAKEREQSWVGAMTEYFPSDSLTEDYPSVGTAPPVQEWTGPPSYQSPREFMLQIANIKFRTGIQIGSDFIRRAKLPVVDRYLRSLAQREMQHWARLLIALLEKGETTLLRETGANFFSTGHQYGANPTQSNLIQYQISNADTTSPKPVDLAEAFLFVINEVLQRKDDHDEPMNEGYSVFDVLVPHNLFIPAKQALGLTIMPTADGSGVQQSPIVTMDGFSIRLSATSRLSWNSDFVVSVGDSPDKGVIFQEEESARKEDVLGGGSEWEAQNDSWLYQVRSSRGSGFGSWQKMAKGQLIAA